MIQTNVDKFVITYQGKPYTKPMRYRSARKAYIRLSKCASGLGFQPLSEVS